MAWLTIQQERMYLHLMDLEVMVWRPCWANLGQWTFSLNENSYLVLGSDSEKPVRTLPSTVNLTKMPLLKPANKKSVSFSPTVGSFSLENAKLLRSPDWSACSASRSNPFGPIENRRMIWSPSVQIATIGISEIEEFAEPHGRPGSAIEAIWFSSCLWNVFSESRPWASSEKRIKWQSLVEIIS